MKEILYIFKIKTTIDHTFLKVKTSRDEILKKHPQKTDLLKSMLETQDDLLEIKTAWSILSQELSTTTRRLMALEIENQKLMNEIRDLRKTNQNLLNNSI
tara:strand:+ start:1114 stop:1413 length:300 start_codon:yes stop_codon:yes gene_type:complete